MHHHRAVRGASEKAYRWTIGARIYICEIFAVFGEVYDVITVLWGEVFKPFAIKIYTAVVDVVRVLTGNKT
jgi:hemolysin-activating ACP:hemolysin acyltransferase